VNGSLVRQGTGGAFQTHIGVGSHAGMYVGRKLRLGSDDPALWAQGIAAVQVPRIRPSRDAYCAKQVGSS